MRKISRRMSAALFLVPVILLFLTCSASAQIAIHPSIGFQTLLFVGDAPAANPISPGIDRELPLGGGMSGTHTGVRLAAEIIPDPEGILRFPISAEYHGLIGKTTFSLSPPQEERKRRSLFRNTADLYSVGLGVTASFFSLPSLYVSLEGRYYYSPSTDLYIRFYYADTDETYRENTVQPEPDPISRIGGYFRVGTQVDFYDPFLLDFNVGLGAMNLFGKDTNPATQRDLFIVDNQLHNPETTLLYFGIGFSVSWVP